ncbi:MAG TPA: hypothetical protein DHW64_01565 [Chitinophagaceae bacterium]|nr:hypothetical protein [Chitinophagaceae bacterium]
MKKIIPVTIFCFSLLTSIDCQSQKTALLYQESKRAFIETTVDKNGIISFTSVPDSIVVFIGTSAAGRIIQFNKDSDVFYLSMDNKEKEGLSVLPYLNKEKLVLVFRNNELIAINQNLITPRKLIPDKAGKPYITILSTSVAVATAAKSPCAEIDKSNPTLNDARIIAKTEITDTISFLPHNFTTTPEDILYLVNKFDHHSGHLPKNYIIHDTRKGTTKTFSIKRDKGNSVINTFDAKVKNYITTLIITTKKEKPVLHINETDFVIDQKPGFEAAVSAIIKTPDEENTNPVPFETLLPKTGKSVDTDPKNLSGLVDQLVNTAIKGRKANNKLIDTLAKELKLCFSCVDSLKQQIEDLTLSNDELKKKIVTLLSSSIKLTE